MLAVKSVFEARQVVRVDNHVAATDVNFIFQREGDRHGRKSRSSSSSSGHDGFTVLPLLPEGRAVMWIALADNAGGDRAAVTAKVEVGTVHVLYREAEILEISVGADLDVFQHPHQVRLVPGAYVAHNGRRYLLSADIGMNVRSSMSRSSVKSR